MAKESWENYREGNNPYQSLPSLSLFTYQMSEMITDKINQGALISGEENIDYAFDLNEFFKTKEDGSFEHEAEVKKFLESLVMYEKFPFSTAELREEVKHSLWLLNRVASAKALKKLLEAHTVFENYEIILAVGSGQLINQESEDSSANKKSLDRVKTAIKAHNKTITLSVGQLTTGITIPEWTVIFMLSNLNSPSLYMQAAFCAQNGWTFTDKSGVRRQKKNAYVFDSAPERTLTIFDEFANNLNSRAAMTIEECVENLRVLLNFFPVISEDSEGKMVELDSMQVLTLPKILKAHEVVRRGFMSNLLFANISGIFAYQEIYKDILDKLPEEKEGKSVSASSLSKIPQVDVDQSGQAIPQEEIVINKTKAIFGEKVFEIEIPELEEILENSKVEEELKKIAAAAIRPNLDKIPEYFDKKLTKNQIEVYEKQTKERVVETIKKEKVDYGITQAYIEQEKVQAIEQVEQESQSSEELELKVSKAQTAFTEKIAQETQELIRHQARAIVYEQEQKQE